MSFQREEHDSEILVFISDGSYGYKEDFVDITKFDNETDIVEAASEK